MIASIALKKAIFPQKIYTAAVKTVVFNFDVVVGYTINDKKLTLDLYSFL
jgi:hypothetical protein